MSTDKEKKIPHNIASPENKAKRNKALKDFHSNPDKPTSATVPREGRAMGNLARSLSDMMEVSLANIKKVVQGDAKITKSQADMSRWVVTQQIATKKAAQEERLRKLELLAKEKSAKDSGLVRDRTAAELAAEFRSANGASLVSVKDSVTAYDPSWDEEDEFSYQEDDEN